MKKLGKKLSYFMRVFLACGLLFSNLSSLSVVFADELENENQVAGETEGEDKKENTLGEGETPSVDETLSEEGEKEVLGEEAGEEDPDEKPGEEDTPAEDENGEETPAEDETEGEDEGETPTEDETEVEITYEVYVDGALYSGDVYDIPASKDAKLVEIKATLTGATADDSYTLRVDDVGEFTAAELVSGATVYTDELEGNLYGSYCIDLMGTFIDPEGMEEDFEEYFCVDYGEDSDNDAALSAVNADYVFSNNKLTVANFDLETVTSIVTSTFSKVTVEYDEENKELWLEDAHMHCVAYMKVTGDELYGDINEDGVVDEKDLDAMIEQMIANVPVNILADLNNDGYVDEVDVIYLRQLLDKGEVTGATQEEVEIPAKFDEFTNPVKVGDEFTLQYVVTLNEYTFNGISGYVSYDEELLDLTDTKVNYFSLGDIDNGRFLYLGDALKLEKEVKTEEDGTETVTYKDVDYVLVTLTFKALAAGDTTVYADGIVYLNEESYYYSYEGVSADVTIEESDEEEDPTEEESSSFTSLSVAGQDITFEDGATTYKLDVANDVTAVDLDYVLADNVSVVSLFAPDELEVGDNTIEITVLDNGVEKTYTITVTRAAEAEEETTEEVAAPVNYTPSSYEEPTSSDDKEVKPDDTKDDDKKDDAKKDGLSRIIIIILILLVIAGLIYLIFRDEDDEETKKANKEVEKLKREDLVKEVPKKNNSPNRNNNKNNKKGR